MSSTRIGTILGTASCADILLYVRDHPRCLKSDIYRNVTRNAHTRELMDTLRSEGLLSIEPTGRGNVHFLELTDRGMRVADLLLRLEEVLDGPSQDGSRSGKITQDQSVYGSSPSLTAILQSSACGWRRPPRSCRRRDTPPSGPR